MRERVRVPCEACGWTGYRKLRPEADSCPQCAAFDTVRKVARAGSRAEFKSILERSLSPEDGARCLKRVERDG